MPKITIPLNSGCHQELDQRLLGSDKLRAVINGRLDREGRIRVRAGYTALSMKVQNAFVPANSTLMIAYDLSSLNSRLVALGDIDERPGSGQLGPGYAVDLFEYTGLTAQPWRASTERATANVARRLPSATDLRDLGILGDTTGGARAAACSALGGHVLMTWEARGDTVSGITGQQYARIVLAETGQLMTHSSLSIGTANHIPQKGRATTTASKLVVVVADFGTGGGGTRLKLFGYTYTPGTSTTLSQVATALITVAAKTLGYFNVCTVTGGDGIALAVVEDVGTGVIQVRRYDGSLAVVTPSGGQYANISLGSDPDSIAIEADVTSDTLTVVCSHGGDLKIFSYVLSTGATIGAPPYGATTQSTDDIQTTSFSVGVCRYDADEILISMHAVRNGVPTSSNAVILATYRPADHDESVRRMCVIRDSLPASTPIVKDGEALLAVKRIGDVAFSGTVGDVVVISTVLTTDFATLSNIVVPQAAPDLGVTGRFFQFLPDMTQDATTGKYYWCRCLFDASGFEVPDVTEFELGSTARRQMVEMAGNLYISGGIVLQYDGKTLSEAGWLERPRILSITPSNSTGTLDNSHTYTYVATWDYVDANGDISRGPVSFPFEVTMGAAEDTNTVVVSVPLSMRLNARTINDGSSIRVRLWRNTVDVVDTVETPSSLLQLVSTMSVDQSFFAGQTVSFVDTMPDSTLVDQEVLYTQVQSPLDNHASQPAKYLSIGNECLMSSGLHVPSKWNISKPLQPDETVSYAQNGTLAFEGRVQRGELEQAMGFAQSWLLATQRELWLLNGSGPDIRGIGEFQRQYRIPSDGGMRADGWRSVVEFGKGVMFQLEDDQLYLWAGGAPKPVGLEIQDTMLEFPNVMAACHVKGQQCVALALQNDAGDDGVIALWDQVTDQWFIDDVGVVDALAEHDGRLAYLQGGVVYLEDSDYGSGTAVPLTVDTGNVARTGSAGAGGVERMLATGVYQGDCTAELLIKYTDDQSFTSLGTQDLLAADGYSAGDPFDLEWAPNRDDVSRFELRLSITSTASNTKQAWCNAIEVHYTEDDGPKRMGDARRR
jgi:hypothetical protein